MRLHLFRLVFEIGTHSQNQINNRSNPVELWDESWSLLGNLYEALAEVEKKAMKTPHAHNLGYYIDARAAEIAQEDAAELARHNAASA